MSEKDHGLIDRRGLLGAAALAGVWASPAAANTVAGLVTAVSGEVSAQIREAKRLLSPEGQVFVGDRILTGSGARAGFKLGQSTELRLGERARVTIDRFVVEAGGVITLGSGAVVVEKDPASTTQEMAIRSSYGLIAVRGTRFFAGPSIGVFGVFVIRGIVAVMAAGEQVILAAGDGTDIARPGAPPTPGKAWGQARIEAALAQVA
jgi:hypothetical protein